MDIFKGNKALIDEKFQETVELAGDKKEEIIKKLNNCSGLEKCYMKFLYASMPLSDLANYSFDLFRSFAEHAVYLKENINWVNNIPEDIFLNYVLLYRINNENIEDCRKIFYDLIKDRIKNKTMKEAALEINYWCLEQMTYRSTDERTASPLTSLRSAYGRCGEESTFTVTALRSVGIPARQVYVPRWSHCDDNHAWVEAWCDGSWYCLGACEPEPVLDKGWFNAAASRAMVVTSKVFSPFCCDEEVISKNKRVSIINNIKKYADCRKITVQVIDNNRPVEGVQINFQILNYSEFFTSASCVTDKEGRVFITLGLGSLNINAVKDGKALNLVINTKEEEFILLQWDNASEEEISSKEFDIIAPEDNMNYVVTLKTEENIMAKKRFEFSNNLRKEKEKVFLNDEKAEIIAEKHEWGKEYIKNILTKSKGNHGEIEEFLNENDDAALFADKVKMLIALTEKDYLDITKNMLRIHFDYSVIYKENYPEDIFYEYLMNPRIYFEQITDYRKFILEYISRDLQQKFRRQPECIWSYIQDNIMELPDKEYYELYTLPIGALLTKSGSLLSKKILFAAICRTLGIPARINKENLSAEYYKDGKFVNVQEEKHSKKVMLTLLNEDGTCWKYMQNWSLGILHKGVCETLNLTARDWTENKLVLLLEPGNYRIITSNRIPKGNIFSKDWSFMLKDNKTKGISLRKIRISDILKNILISDFKLRDEQGSYLMASEILGKSINAVFWLEEGKEPTEHVLNELIGLKDVINAMKCNILFILKDKNSLANVKLQEIIKAIPGIKLYYDDFNYNVSFIARRMYLNPDELPLSVITKDGLNVIYSFSGYNVGTIDLIIRIIKSL